MNSHLEVSGCCYFSFYALYDLSASSQQMKKRKHLNNAEIKQALKHQAFKKKLDTLGRSSHGTKERMNQNMARTTNPVYLRILKQLVSCLNKINAIS